MQDSPKWYNTGHEQEIPGDRIRRAEQLADQEIAQATKEHRHYWTAVVMYKVNPPLMDGAILDIENLRSRPAVGCFICERVYGSPGLGARCKGEPR